MLSVYFCLSYPKYIRIFSSTQLLVSHKATTRKSLILSNLSFKLLQIYTKSTKSIHNPNINDITMTTDDEAISSECIDDLMMNVIKSIRYMKKRPDYSSICDYVNKLLSNSDITEDIVSNRLLYLTDNNKIKNKPTNGRDSYYIIDEIPLQVGTPPNSFGKSLSLNPTNENGGDKNNQHEEIENVIVELTVLKLFVQEQIYIMKKWKKTFRNQQNSFLSYLHGRKKNIVEKRTVPKPS